MKIGKLIKQHIKKIFFHCDNVEHDEIYSLLDPHYSKITFGVNFPFCIEIENLEPSQSKRYWTEIYLVRDKRVRVTSQWFETSRSPFIKYLHSKGIALELDLPGYESNEDQATGGNWRNHPQAGQIAAIVGTPLATLRISSLEIFSAALGLSLLMRKIGMPRRVISRTGAPIVALKQNC